MPAEPHPSLSRTFRRELSDWRLWKLRALVLAFACLAGMTVVAFTWTSELALAQFRRLEALVWWGPLLWTPVSAACIVWLTRRYAPGAAGSGIPQIMASLSLGPASRSLFVSLRLTIAKFVLTGWGLLAGLSLGREGPSVQIAAGVMHMARRWIPQHSVVSEHGLLIAGGAAGIAAAFNAPLAGVIFAVEELSRKPEQRSNGLVMAAIILGGLMAVSAFGNSTYFGVIRPDRMSLQLLAPGLLLALTCGLCGGLFARLMVLSLSGESRDRPSAFRRRAPVRFAALCGLMIAIIGVSTHGATFGSGYAHTRAMIEGTDGSSIIYLPLKVVATWLTAWSGVPGGIFAPSLAIGGALGNEIAHLMLHGHAAILIAWGMAAYLAAVTQAPLTAFVIVMEMVDGHGLVLSLMTSALLASGVSRLVSVPLYSALADLQARRAGEGEP